VRKKPRPAPLAQRGLGGLLTGRAGLDEVVEEHVAAGGERLDQAGDDAGRVLLVADVVEDAAGTRSPAEVVRRPSPASVRAHLRVRILRDHKRRQPRACREPV
jgi:hypothetical protein